MQTHFERGAILITLFLVLRLLSSFRICTYIKSNFCAGHLFDLLVPTTRSSRVPRVMKSILFCLLFALQATAAGSFIICKARAALSPVRLKVSFV